MTWPRCRASSQRLTRLASRRSSAMARLAFVSRADDVAYPTVAYVRRRADLRQMCASRPIQKARDGKDLNSDHHGRNTFLSRFTEKQRWWLVSVSASA